MAMAVFIRALVLLLLSTTITTALQPLPPITWDSTTTTTTNNTGEFVFTARTHQHTVYLRAAAAQVSDDDGLTLIPPTALQFARVFADDLTELFGGGGGGRFSVRLVQQTPEQGIYLDVLGDRDGFAYQNGEKTSEGYHLTVGQRRVSIEGSGARGMWWGTRTLLQQLVLAKGTNVSGEAKGSKGGEVALAVGTTTDAPAFKTRGFMLDAGRKWYSAKFLGELCTYASFFKLSEFHLHLSDNYPLNRGHNETWQDVYSQFSLLPEDPSLRGLVTRANETHTRASFSSLQQHCAARGVTIVPELEAPGHALAITKWKPQLALSSPKDLLNLTHPETIPLVKKIWAEFLPWFKSKEVSIGADEYDAALADDYIAFVNSMSTFISEKSGKRIRIWGTLEPSSTLEISKDVVIQHWQYGQSDPVALAQAGYDVINSEDYWAYMSLKNDHTPVSPAPYPQFFNATRVLDFAGQDGWQWEPALFNPTNLSQQLPSNATHNRGAIMAAWNDDGPDATTQLEAFYAIRDGLPLVGARAWSGSRGPLLDVGTVNTSVELLSAVAPGQDLDRHKPSTDSLGPPYALRVDYTAAPFTLSSADASLALLANGSLVMTTADGWPYPLRSVSEAASGVAGRIWVNDTSSTHEVVQVPGAGGSSLVIETDVLTGTRVWSVSDGGKGERAFLGRFEVFVFGGRNTLFSWSQMAFAMPLRCSVGHARVETL